VFGFDARRCTWSRIGGLIMVLPFGVSRDQGRLLF
jgi:hypothetical protein